MADLPLSLNPADCDQCGECIRACPTHALKLDGSFITVDPGLCDGCEDCALACPTTAITVARARRSRDRDGAARVHPPRDADQPATAAAAGLGDVIPLRRPERPKVWSLGDLALGMGFLVLLQVGLKALPVPSGAQPLDRFIVLAETLAFYGLILAWIALIARRRGASRETLGLAPFKAAASTAAVVGLMIALLITRQQYVDIARMLGFQPPSVEHQLLGLFGKGTGGLVLALIVTVGLAPVVEELFFRGFVYGVLRERVRPGWAVLLSALIFAIYHFSLWLVVPIVLLGIALAWLVEWQRSVWPAIICHAVNNALAVLVVYGGVLSRPAGG